MTTILVRWLIYVALLQYKLAEVVNLLKLLIGEFFEHFARVSIPVLLIGP